MFKKKNRRKLSQKERVERSIKAHHDLEFKALKKGDSWLERYHKTCWRRQEWENRILSKDERKGIFAGLMREKSYEANQK